MVEEVTNKVGNRKLNLRFTNLKKAQPHGFREARGNDVTVLASVAGVVL